MEGRVAGCVLGVEDEELSRVLRGGEGERKDEGCEDFCDWEVSGRF